MAASGQKAGARGSISSVSTCRDAETCQVDTYSFRNRLSECQGGISIVTVFLHVSVNLSLAAEICSAQISRERPCQKYNKDVKQVIFSQCLWNCIIKW